MLARTDLLPSGSFMNPRHAAVGEELAVHLIRQAQLHPDIGQPRPLLVPIDPPTSGRRAGLAVT